MVEGARLESVYTLTGIEGSNPSLSTIDNEGCESFKKDKPPIKKEFLLF